MKKLYILFIFLLNASLLAYSQYTVSGKVKTSSGVPISNVRVTLFNGDTTIFFEKRTNANGVYTIRDVSAGNYTIGIASVGKEYKESHINVTANISGLNFRLDNESQPGNWNIIIESPEPLGGTDLGILLPTGKIFYCHNTRDPFEFDPLMNDTILIKGDDYVQGCVGPVLLPDGKVIFAGGTEQEVYGPGTRKVKAYDPVTGVWQVKPHMLDYRWYPTITKLPDNRLLLAGGGGLNNPQRVKTSEIYNSATGLSNWVDSIAIGNEVSPIVLLYNGTVLMTHRPPQLFNPVNNQWKLAKDFVQGNRMANGDHSDHELVLLPDGRAVAVGYKSFTDNPGNFIEIYNPVIDTWSLGSNFSPVRSRAKAVLTPDKKILVIAGYKEQTSDTTSTNQWGFMNITDQLDPYTGAWRRLDNMNYRREYHALAILVPDGRIIVTGGEGQPGIEPPFSVIEAFTPPYLLRGIRPQIKNLSATDFSRGETINFNIQKTKSPSSIILMSNAVVTHFMNSGNNRYVELPFSKTGNNIIATLSADSLTLPDGYYMLFAMVDDIPSIAKIIRIQGTQLKDIKVIANENGVNIFPNPASGFLIVSLSTEMTSVDLKLSIEDELGKIVYQSTVAKGTSALTIQIAHLSAGIYFLKIFDGRKIHSNKFIKD